MSRMRNPNTPSRSAPPRAPAWARVDRRALYLPKSWTKDSDRCEVPGIAQDDRGISTTPTLATSLIDRAVAAWIPAARVAGRRRVRSRPTAARGRGLGYVLAIAANRHVPTHAGAIRVDALPALIPTHAWKRHSVGVGAHGLRLYSWAWFRLLGEDDTDTGLHHLLIRRNVLPGNRPTCAATHRVRCRCTLWWPPLRTDVADLRD